MWLFRTQLTAAVNVHASHISRSGTQETRQPSFVLLVALAAALYAVPLWSVSPASDASHEQLRVGVVLGYYAPVMSVPRNTIGQPSREARLACGLRQLRLALLAGVNMQTMWQIEAGAHPTRAPRRSSTSRGLWARRSPGYGRARMCLTIQSDIWSHHKVSQHVGRAPRDRRVNTI